MQTPSCERPRRGVCKTDALRLTLAALFFSAASVAFAAIRVTDLKCEFGIDPLGIDVAQPRLFWRIAAEPAEARGEKQTAYQILVATSADALAQDRGDLWDSGRVAGDATTFIHYAGKPLASSQQVFWKVRAWGPDGAESVVGRGVPAEPSAWSAPATWTMGLLKATDWKGAWICAPATTETLLLRHEFNVKPGLRRAIAHVTGLGQYEMFLNGGKVGDEIMSPGWTDYDVTTLYDTRDVTAQLREGANAVGLALGNGMYHVVRRNRFAKFTGSFGPLRAILHLRLEYADGSVEVVGTDETWRTHAGPITFSSIYGGEDYDARLEPRGWKNAGFNARDWPAAVLVNRPADTLRGFTHAAEPIRAIETHLAANVRELKPGVVLYDFGQEALFMPRLRVSGPAGSVVRMTAGEVINPDGTIDRSTMGGAHRGTAYWQYTKATDGEESWFPQFYFVGSRYLYVELERVAGASTNAALPKIESLEQVVVHSTAEPVGTFETSNPLLNRIRDLVRWAQRSNIVSILMDCPHREKLGWLEQTHLNGYALRYHFDLSRLYEKQVQDMAMAQTPAGAIPNIAPEYTQFKGTFRFAAEWGAAFIAVPWQQYLFTGDVDVLRWHYDEMKRYFAYLESRAEKDILSEGLGDWYDHVAGKSGRANLTPPPITATAFYFQDAQLLSQIAAVLGRTDEARKYAARAEEIRFRYNQTFFAPDSVPLYGSGSQTSLALPLAMGIAEPAQRARVLDTLVRDVEAKGYAQSGAAGFRYLLRALADNDRSDTIYKFVNQDDKPGYGYILKQGATTMTEAWDASRGSSWNHFFLGQVIEWYYRDVAGIDTDPAGPGFKHIIIRPQPVGDLRWAEASYNSIHGPIAVRWDRNREKLGLRVRIPANTTATIFVPAREGAAVTEGGAPVEQARGVKFLRRERDRNVYAVEAGTYAFASTW